MFSSINNAKQYNIEENDIFTEICTQLYSNQINNRRSIIFSHLFYGEKLKGPFASLKIISIEEGEALIEPMEKVKIHISLTYADYKNYKDEIKNIILDHLEKHSINRFKMVNCMALDKKLKEENDKSLKRFRDGDQFTLYVPKDYSHENISNLLDAINKFIQEHSITESGAQSDVAISLTPQINIRLEYFSCGDDKKRIDAIQKDDEQASRRIRAVLELQMHPLYLYLADFFSRSPPLRYT